MENLAHSRQIPKKTELRYDTNRVSKDTITEYYLTLTYLVTEQSSG